jgi:uncharacterized protein (TIGR00251 family)
MGLNVQHTPEGLILKVKVAPRARREGVLGLLGDSLKVAVSAVPEKGKANQRLLQVLAQALQLPEHRLQLLTGHGDRHKRVRIQELSIQELQQRLAAWL